MREVYRDHGWVGRTGSRELIDIALEALAHQELPLKDVIHKPSGRTIQHNYTPPAHTAGFASECPPDLVPAQKLPLYPSVPPLSHQRALYLGRRFGK